MVMEWIRYCPEKRLRRLGTMVTRSARIVSVAGQSTRALYSKTLDIYSAPAHPDIMNFTVRAQGTNDLALQDSQCNPEADNAADYQYDECHQDEHPPTIFLFVRHGYTHYHSRILPKNTSSQFYQDKGLLQTLKDVHAPETHSTGLVVDVTVLAEILTIHIITQGKVTVETERIVVFKDITPEVIEVLVVPNIQDHSII